MNLKQLELLGFKSFAKRTTLDFPSGITAIVGPNGSGKSNIADAVRWILAEKAFKNLRGKKGEDLIFHGSTARHALSRAHVTLTLNGSEEVIVERAVARSGEGVYRLNNRSVRLQDLEAFFARSGIGSSSFRVLSQGMSDLLITLGPEEFREFIEDAAGVREYQEKRHRSLLKLNTARENLNRVSVLLAELNPRLKFLEREYKKLTRKDALKTELAETARQFFGTRYQRLLKEEKERGEKRKGLEVRLAAAEKEIAVLEQPLFKESENSSAKTLEGLTNEISAFEGDLRALERAQIRLEGKTAYVGLTKEYIIAKLRELLNAPASAVKEKLKDLIGELESEDKNPAGFEKELLDLEEKKRKRSEELKAVLVKDKARLLEFEKEYREKSKTLERLRLERNTFALDEEKTIIHRSELEREVKNLGLVTLADLTAAKFAKTGDETALEEKLLKLRRRVEDVGAVDPAVVEEYRGVKERTEFLSRESNDLAETLSSLEKLIKEVDREIKGRFETTLQTMSAGFNDYFRLVFNGGKGTLEKEEEGIEIKVELPNKKVKGLGMLSGGERSLVSIALLFALVTVRKPPFLVLDEIDAALDEVNSQRFIRLVRELAKTTQFVIITHNRETMRGADALYGVSMKDGISQLLSIKLEEQAPLIPFVARP